MESQLPARPGLERERRLALIAARQHGVVSRRQLIELGFGAGAIARRLEAKRLHRVHRGVYALGRPALSQSGRWLAAVLACGEGALLSHRSAAALWGLARSQPRAIDVSSMRGRGRPGLTVHESSVNREERVIRSAIPVTSVARTLFDLAEVLDLAKLERSFEEADRLKLLELRTVEAVCERNPGRRALASIRRLVSIVRAPAVTRSPLENDFADFCRRQDLPTPVFNATVLGFEVDALWPDRRLVVELDGFRFHHHRGAFERDRERDAALQAAGYRVIRLTHRRLEADRPRAARQLRALLG